MPMQLQFLSNLNYSIGDVINQQLQNAANVQIAVAFLKYSGVEVIKKSLNTCLDNNGSFELITGLDFKTTDYESMHYFMTLKKQYPKAKFYCFGDRKENKTPIVFHPKIYLFENKQETTGIVGSANLTKGGLTSNFEVNAILKEPKTKPLYFSQLQAIYNNAKFADTVFTPDDEYLAGYSDIYKAYVKNEESAKKDKGLLKAIKYIQDKETTLPGTIPSLKKLIIEVIKQKQKDGQMFVPLSELYTALRKIVAEDEHLKFNMDTFNNTVRGEINHHENSNTSNRSLRLFLRSQEKQGLYTLTENGKNYQGR